MGGALGRTWRVEGRRCEGGGRYDETRGSSRVVRQLRSAGCKYIDREELQLEPSYLVNQKQEVGKEQSVGNKIIVIP